MLKIFACGANISASKYIYIYLRLKNKYMRRILKLHHECWLFRLKKKFFWGRPPRAAKRNSALSKPERSISACLEKNLDEKNWFSDDRDHLEVKFRKVFKKILRFFLLEALIKKDRFYRQLAETVVELQNPSHVVDLDWFDILNLLVSLV